MNLNIEVHSGKEHYNYRLANNNKNLKTVATFSNLISLSFQHPAKNPNLIITLHLVLFYCSKMATLSSSNIGVARNLNSGSLNIHGISIFQNTLVS